MTGLIPNDAVAIGVGAFFGAMSRYQAGRLAGEWIAKDPSLKKFQGWHTAAINVGGSFALGVVTAFPLFAESPKPSAAPSFALSTRAKLMLGVGFCGSFTTFSTYSVDIATWIAQGHTSAAMRYVMVNNVGGVTAAFAGVMLVNKIFKKM